MFCQYFQDPPDHPFMLLFHLRKDQNVVQVHYDDPFCYDGSEDVVHHSLEGSGAIGHSEKHYEGFKETTVGVEGCFPFVSRLDVYIIETPADVQFCEIPGSAELGDEFRDERERIPVLNGYSVQYMVVFVRESLSGNHPSS